MDGGSPVVGLSVRPDGTIVGATRGGRVFSLTPDGALDRSFGTGGYVQTFPHLQGIALDTDGRVVLAGASPDERGRYRIGVGRLSGDGKPDPTFGAQGRTVFSPDAVYNFGSVWVALRPGGKIVVAANAWQWDSKDRQKNVRVVVASAYRISSFIEPASQPE